MHLRYSLETAFYKCQEWRHPQIVMRILGIRYQMATPQSMCEQWWFWNCENVPDDLPEFLTQLGMEPIDAVGYGLSEQDAEAIKRNEK